MEHYLLIEQTNIIYEIMFFIIKKLLHQYLKENCNIGVKDFIDLVITVDELITDGFYLLNF